MQSTVRYRQVDKERRGRPTAGVKHIVHNNSGVAKGTEGAVAPMHRRPDRGRKTASPKYLTPNDHKSEYDKVWWMSQKYSLSQHTFWMLPDTLVSTSIAF